MFDLWKACMSQLLNYESRSGQEVLGVCRQTTEMGWRLRLGGCPIGYAWMIVWNNVYI